MDQVRPLHRLAGPFKTFLGQCFGFGSLLLGSTSHLLDPEIKRTHHEEHANEWRAVFAGVEYVEAASGRQATLKNGSRLELGKLTVVVHTDAKS